MVKRIYLKKQEINNTKRIITTTSVCEQSPKKLIYKQLQFMQLYDMSKYFTAQGGKILKKRGIRFCNTLGTKNIGYTL